mmetsp:Transcript_29599/g.67071  ORF Transcript_29599/g.67071 Transcript_29599/m.67071 type:complete len:329 (-) Transcript_29599:221-1207(-)
MRAAKRASLLTPTAPIPISRWLVQRARHCTVFGERALAPCKGSPRPTASRLVAGPKAQILQQTLTMLAARHELDLLRNLGKRLLRCPARHLAEPPQHEGPVLVLRQGKQVLPGGTQQLEYQCLLLRLGAVRQSGLDDMAGAPVKSVCLQVRVEGCCDPRAVLRRVLQHDLEDVVGEGVPAMTLCLCEHLREELPEALAAAAVLHEPAEHSAAEAVARHPSARAQQLPNHEGARGRRQGLDDRLEHVVAVLRGQQVEHAAVQLLQELSSSGAVSHPDGSLHKAATLAVQGKLRDGASHRSESTNARLVAGLQGIGQRFAVQADGVTSAG